MFRRHKRWRDEDPIYDDGEKHGSTLFRQAAAEHRSL